MRVVKQYGLQRGLAVAAKTQPNRRAAGQGLSLAGQECSRWRGEHYGKTSISP